MVTEIDQALERWLATHHIQARDVKSWSGMGEVHDMTELTITFYVSGVDEIPVPGLVLNAPADISDAEYEELKRQWLETYVHREPAESSTLRNTPSVTYPPAYIVGENGPETALPRVGHEDQWEKD